MNSRDNLTSFPSVGARIRTARKRAGLSQQALAERLRVDYAQLGGDAGYIGAAGLARQEWLQKQS